MTSLSKYPITVERLPVFVLLGHSNGDGWVGTNDLFSPYSHLLPGTSDPAANPASAWYKNVYVFTSEHPWPTVSGTPFTTLISDGAWLELAVGFPDSPAAAFPHPSPFVYPNNAGACYPHWYYEAFTGISLAGDGSYTGHNGVRFGLELPFQWLWRNHWNSQVGFVKLAFGSSFLLPLEAAGSAAVWLNAASWTPGSAQWKHGTVDTVNSGQDHISWWTPADCFDFAPSTDRFFQRWLDKMGGAQAALPEGTKMDVQLLIPWMGDNDSLARLLSALTNFKQFVLEFVDKARQACVDNDWTTLAKHEIPVIWPGVYPTYDNLQNSPTSTPEYLNEILQAIADDDPYFATFDTGTLTTMFAEGQLSAIDTTNHFGARGYVTAAETIFDLWLGMQTDPFDALDPDERITFLELKNRIRTYYNRARSQTDADDDTLKIHANGSMHSILNAVGDNNYWLRRRETMALSLTFGAVVTMPRRVGRVVKIEDLLNPTTPIMFELVGFADSGKVQIQITDKMDSVNAGTTSTGSFTLHYITRPKDLSRDDQLVPMPRSITEWLVVETCRRLARSGSNVALLGSMEGEARDLRERCLKELQVTVRAKRERLKPLTTQWRMPGYGRGCN